MAHERLRSLLKLSDELAKGRGRTLARQAIRELRDMPGDEVATLFDAGELTRLPNWSRGALFRSLRHARKRNGAAAPDAAGDDRDEWVL